MVQITQCLLSFLRESPTKDEPRRSRRNDALGVPEELLGTVDAPELREARILRRVVEGGDLSVRQRRVHCSGDSSQRVRNSGKRKELTVV